MESKINIKLESDVKITLELSVEEATALHAITLYGSKNFLEVFYKHLGSSYLKPNEKGLISLFDSSRYLQGAVNRVHEIKKQINDIKNGK